MGVCLVVIDFQLHVIYKFVKISLLVFVMRLGSRKGDGTTKSLRWSTNSKHSTDMANIYPLL
jgi:hypothetical protein